MVPEIGLENIAVENSSGPVGQAVALHVEGGRCAFINCRFLGNQDAVYAAGRYSSQYFKDCFIEGTTDFIFGEATAVFEKCAIHCKSDLYITAASTPEGKPFGFVFLNCKITLADGVEKVYLGRLWRIYSKAAYLNCKLGSFIAPEGWNSWPRPESEKTTVFAEYDNTGDGALVTMRFVWSVKLFKRDAAKYSKENIFTVSDWKKSSPMKWYNDL